MTHHQEESNRILDKLDASHKEMVHNLEENNRILDKLDASHKEMMHNLEENNRILDKLDASRKEEKLIYERVTTLDNYRWNGDNCLEYCVSDIVDNVMRGHGFLLECREHNRKIWDKYGSEVAELDGLLVYEHEITQKKVLVMVEAKSNMIRCEFEKVYKTKEVFENAIKEGAKGDSGGVIKYKRQCGDLMELVDYNVHVAVGSPGMLPHDIVDEAKEQGFLVVQRSNDSYFAINGAEWMQ